jgi:hypothetical protein
MATGEHPDFGREHKRARPGVHPLLPAVGTWVRRRS